MSGIVTVYAVFGSHDEAERIGRAMIAERLAACVNILAPCTSVYRWEGAIEMAQEVPALFKTSAADADALVAEIAARHSYAVPAIAVWPIVQTPDSYAAWVQAETGT
ncbi:MAG: divalent-cation tolerance protein CutA [Sphingomonadaceae bacterium]